MRARLFLLALVASFGYFTFGVAVAWPAAALPSIRLVWVYKIQELHLICWFYVPASLPLSDETKKFQRDRYRDIFLIPKFLRPRLFFETKYFWDRYWDFFETKYFRDRYWDFSLRPNIFETDTETFFRDQMFSRPIPRLFFETKCYRDRYWDFFETKFFRDWYRDFCKS